MRFAWVLPLLLPSLPLVAQMAHPGDAPSQFRVPKPSLNCPVELKVNRVGGLIARNAEDGGAPQGQGLDLRFFNTVDRQVVSAEIAVHGYAAAGLSHPLLVAVSGPRAEEFHLGGSGQRTLSTASVWTRGISAVTWIELTSVAFSDGGSWVRSKPGDCVIEPSLLVLVK